MANEHLQVVVTTKCHTGREGLMVAEFPVQGGGACIYCLVQSLDEAEGLQPCLQAPLPWKVVLPIRNKPLSPSGFPLSQEPCSACRPLSPSLNKWPIFLFHLRVSSFISQH